MTHTIAEPDVPKGNQVFQVSSSYRGSWDADNINIMRALYCILFSEIKQSKQCLRTSRANFYEAKTPERIGETLNSYNTMLGDERLFKENIQVNKDFQMRLNEFKCTYHKPGNFMPFPSSLNYSNGYDNKGWNYLGDFFDVKLSIIKKQWRNIGQGTTEVPLLNMNKDFFAPFTDFKEFCKYFYLEKYLNDGEIEFLCNHEGYCNRPKPFTIIECRNYMDNATDIINYRSDKMAENLNTILSEWRKNNHEKNGIG